MAQHQKYPLRKYTITSGSTFRREIVSRKFAYEIVQKIASDVVLPGETIENHKHSRFYSPTWGRIDATWEEVDASS